MPDASASARVRGSQIALTVGAVVVFLGSLLPWLGSGRRDRNSYDLHEVLRALDLPEDGPSRIAVRAWPLLPLLLSVTIVLAWAGARRTAATLATVAGAYVTVVAVAAWRAPLPARAGPLVTLLGAVALLAGAAVLATTSRRRN